MFFWYIMNLYYVPLSVYKFQRVSIPSYLLCINEVFINFKIACMEFIILVEDTNRIDVNFRSTKQKLQSSMAHLGDTPKCININLMLFECRDVFVKMHVTLYLSLYFNR